MSEAPKLAAAPPSPEAEANARITELQAKVEQTQQQILTLEGRAVNRDPNLIARIKKENEELAEAIYAS